MSINLPLTTHLFTFTTEIVNRKLHLFVQCMTLYYRSINMTAVTFVPTQGQFAGYRRTATNYIEKFRIIGNHFGMTKFRNINLVFRHKTK